VTRLGHEVAGAVSTGEDAVNKARELRPDIILMDIGLKRDMDGIEAAAEINSIYDTPIVYVTAYTDSDTKQRMDTTRHAGRLSKPFQEEDLDNIIKNVMNEAAASNM
jgi:DNA-binding NarL/FixJ family response regulator